MSALTRYPVPQAVAAGKVDGPRLHFRLEPTIVPDPVLAFLQPLRGLEIIEAGAVNDPRLYFRAGFVPYPNPRYALAGGMQSMDGGV